MKETLKDGEYYWVIYTKRIGWQIAQYWKLTNELITNDGMGISPEYHYKINYTPIPKPKK